MPVFVYCIAADIQAPPNGIGYVRAETAEEVVALVGHPEVNVYPLSADAGWPEKTREDFCASVGSN